jgi:hypothetical protein
MFFRVYILRILKYSHYPSTPPYPLYPLLTLLLYRGYPSPLDKGKGIEGEGQGLMLKSPGVPPGEPYR